MYLRSSSIFSCLENKRFGIDPPGDDFHCRRMFRCCDCNNDQKFDDNAIASSEVTRRDSQLPAMTGVARGPVHRFRHGYLFAI
ncbi:hypothetical protein M513_12183 [Trichuris suis]|uniref:Uncharacterized protein n=1 Tax=Trichuris suis TaxID=68888 RepID=A0A085LPP1_9BILA|nr:hypothetical protein M513_12183 [Trichuris suis]